jgi:hypothetical protein
MDLNTIDNMYSAERMAQLAKEFLSELESKEVDGYLKRIVAAATGGAFNIIIKDNLKPSQIQRFVDLGYNVCRIIEGRPPTYRICW